MFSKKKKLNYLRKLWAKPIDRFRNFDLISIFHQDVIQNCNAELVDDKTWSDLCLDTLYTKMDRCFSPIGQQYLYHLMHKYETRTDILEKRFDLIRLLKEDSKTREKIQLELEKIDQFNLNYIPRIVFSEIPPKPKFYYLIFLSPLIATVSSLFIPVYPIITLVTISAFLINILLNKIFTKDIYDFFAGFSGLNTLLISAKRLSHLSNEKNIIELNYLKKKNSLTKKLSKQLGKLVVDKTSVNDLVLGAIEYMNMFFLYDLYAYYRSVTVLENHKKEIQNIYEAVAMLDVAQSIASYLEETKVYCNPIFTTVSKIDFQNQYHPLIDNPVPCSLNNLEKSLLITGSNMAGKTTFIKSIGINFILAQTLYFCHAESAKIPQLFVKSAIKRDEDLETGKSYFFVEIEELQEFINLSEDKNKYLFLIDEIFRGTNTTERLAISTAVLEHLNNGAKVLVTTHDIELQELLNNSYEMYHFSDAVENGKFYFTYKLQKDPCTSGNAIKLIEIKDYPKNIVERAKQVEEIVSE